MNILQKQTPNFIPGRTGYSPKVIVLHLMVGTLRGTDSWFASEKSQASSHYGVGYTGEMHQYVQEEDTAWHSGRVTNPTTNLVNDYVGNPNNWTIGIENEGYKVEDLTDTQVRANAELCKEIAKRWNIPLDRQHIIGHYELTSDKPRIDAFVDKVLEETRSFDHTVVLPVKPPTKSAKLIMLELLLKVARLRIIVIKLLLKLKKKKHD